MKGRVQLLAGLVCVLVLVAAVSRWASAAAVGPRAPQSQGNLIQALQQAAGGEVRISHHSETGMVRFVGATTETGIVHLSPAERNLSADQAARSFLNEYGSLFGIDDAERDLALINERTLDDGRSVVRYQQTYQGIPVLGGELMVQMSANKSILSANGEILPDIQVNVMPRVDAEAAQQKALELTAKAHGIDVSEVQATEPALWIYSPALLGGPGLDIPVLAWRTEVAGVELLSIREFVLVDAQTGIVALNFSQIHSGKDRKTYDAQSTSNLPGVLRRSEGQDPYGDPDVDNAHDYAGDTYDFLLIQHGRDSLDGAGLTLVSSVDYCEPGDCPLANAFWNGEQMAYGDGFASADDVVGHELAHGLTQYTSGLFYYFQSGAINESLSDVWGEFVDLSNNAGTDSDSVRWQLGEDLPPSIGVIRDMSDPTIFGDPDRIGSPNYYCDEGDSGGVHINSGVNNKAAYLMVDGGSFNGQTVTGMGIEKVVALYYEAQTNHLTTASSYADLYDALIQASITLGYTPAERQNVRRALLAVEMNQEPCGRDEPASVCPAGQTPVYVFSDDLENPASGNWQPGFNIGSNTWYYPQNTNPFFDLVYATSGDTHFWGYNQPQTADYFIRMTQNVTVPANGYLRFNHDWNFETFFGALTDGGVVEYRVNGGSWTDAGPLFTENGYSGSIDTGWGNPLEGRQAFVAHSYGYTASRLNLNSLAGDDVQFRFRIGAAAVWTDDYGWFIDDVQIYSCSSISYDYNMLLPSVIK